MPPSLILASTSPYRRDLLQRLRVPFECVDSRVDESILKAKIRKPRELTQALALAKAGAVSDQHPHAVVIGADQVVALDETILGKPGDRAGAIRQLTMLTGRTHTLMTSVCLLHDGRKREITSVVQLSMRHLSPAAIERYIDLEQPFDCAGSFKLESAGIALFERIECEDYTSIIGLPLIELTTALIDFGFEIP